MSTLLDQKQRRRSSLSEKYVPWEPYRAATGRTLSQNSPKTAAGETSKVAYRLAVPTRKIRKKQNENEENESKNDPENIERREETEQSDQICDKQPLPEAEKCPDDPFLSAGNQRILERNFEELRFEHARLRLELSHCQQQLQTQTNINSELKKLLVATMGEDLQLHLEGLSEDKVRLAKGIEQYTEQVNLDNENMDQLSIQGDVWRSKFLASSVMVDELVGWRAYLIAQFNSAQKCVQKLMEEHSQMRAAACRTLRSLEIAAKGTDGTGTNHNLLALMSRIELLTNELASRVSRDGQEPMSAHQQIQVTATKAEISAQQLLSVDSSVFYAVTPCDEMRQQMRRKYERVLGFENCKVNNITIGCCKKCAGKEIKLL